MRRSKGLEIMWAPFCLAWYGGDSLYFPHAWVTKVLATTHNTSLDRGCFTPLKVAWRDICHKFCARHLGRIVSRFDFCEKAWLKAFSMPNIINSFEATGIYPFNIQLLQAAAVKSKYS